MQRFHLFIQVLLTIQEGPVVLPVAHGRNYLDSMSYFFVTFCILCTATAPFTATASVTAMALAVEIGSK